MRCLLISNYLDGSTGWAEVGKSIILALDAANVDIVPRAIKLNNSIPSIPRRITELEEKTSRDSQVCIQHVLPHLMEYNSAFKKNIGIFEFETSGFGICNWPNKLALMDALIVANTQIKETIQNTPQLKHLWDKTYVVPTPIDVSKFQQSYQPLNIPEARDTFNFYFVGEVIRRKNLVALIKAFHLEFGINEPVNLIIKGNLFNTGPQDCYKHIETMSAEIKRNMKIYAKPEFYKKEIILTDWMNDDEIMGLHQIGGCYINPSFGESRNLACLDAICCGNYVISNDCGGPHDYMPDGEQYDLVPNVLEPAFGMTTTFDDLQTSRENWWSINVLDLMKSMRKMFEHWKSKNSNDKFIEDGLKFANKYSYEKVGNMMKDIIYDGI